MLLVIVMLVIYINMEICKYRCKILDWQVTTCMGNCCSLFAGDVFDGVFLCCPFSHEMSWMISGT